MITNMAWVKWLQAYFCEMLKLRFYIIFVTLALTSGCFEIVEEIDHKSDGSGTFSYLVNMSQSRDKIAAVLSLDSVNGIRIPSKSDIERQIERGKGILVNAPGIHNVQVTRDYQNYIFTIKFSYDSLGAMNRGAAMVHNEMSPYAQTYKPVFLTDVAGWYRQADAHTIGVLQKLNRQNPSMLKDAKYTTVYRFNQTAFSPDKDAKIAGNKKAIMYSYNLGKLANHPELLQQNIQLK
jgi:hypothetical protein